MNWQYVFVHVLWKIAKLNFSRTSKEDDGKVACWLHSHVKSL